MSDTAEERQDQNNKRRKMEANGSNGIPMVAVTPSPALQLSATPSAPPVHSSLPQRPAFDSFEAQANALGLGAPSASTESDNPAAIKAAVSGSNHDWVANRRAIRMANMSAAEMLKAEMAGLTPVNADSKKNVPLGPSSTSASETLPILPETPVESSKLDIETAASEEIPPGLTSQMDQAVKPEVPPVESDHTAPILTDEDEDAVGELDPDALMSEQPLPDPDAADQFLQGVKRKIDAVESDHDEVLEPDDEDAPPDAPIATARKVNADGTVDQEDTIKYVRQDVTMTGTRLIL